MGRYFNFAHGTRPLPKAQTYPYDIDLCFDPVARPIPVTEGVGYGANGCTLSAAEALEPRWCEHFARTEGEWLLPYIQALAHGIPLPRELMFELYEQRHGRTPPRRGMP